MLTARTNYGHRVTEAQAAHLRSHIGNSARLAAWMSGHSLTTLTMYHFTPDAGASFSAPYIVPVAGGLADGSRIPLDPWDMPPLGAAAYSQRAAPKNSGATVQIALTLLDDALGQPSAAANPALPALGNYLIDAYVGNPKKRSWHKLGLSQLYPLPYAYPKPSRYSGKLSEPWPIHPQWIPSPPSPTSPLSTIIPGRAYLRWEGLVAEPLSLSPTTAAGFPLQWHVARHIISAATALAQHGWTISFVVQHTPLPKLHPTDPLVPQAVYDALCDSGALPDPSLMPFEVAYRVPGSLRHSDYMRDITEQIFDYPDGMNYIIYDYPAGGTSCPALTLSAYHEYRIAHVGATHHNPTFFLLVPPTAGARLERGAPARP